MATDTVHLHPNRHDRLRAERNGTTIPETIPRSTLELVADLKSRGYSFHEIAQELPELLSSDGAHVALLEAIRQPRAPFDGLPGAPAWTPASTTLAGKLRPLERPTSDYPSTPPPADYWDTRPWRIDGTVHHPIHGWGRVINGQHTQADGLPSYLP